MKFTPRSKAASICAWPSASVLRVPQFMLPRHSRLTSIPVRPSRRYFMAFLPGSVSRAGPRNVRGAARRIARKRSGSKRRSGPAPVRCARPAGRARRRGHAGRSARFPSRPVRRRRRRGPRRGPHGGEPAGSAEGPRGGRRRGQGVVRDGGPRRDALGRPALRLRRRALRPRRSDLPDRDGRGRPSDARRGGPPRRGPGAGRRPGPVRRRSRALPDLGRRLRPAGGARPRPEPRRQAGRDRGAAAFGRDDPRDQLRAQTSVRHQGGPLGRRRLARAGRDAGRLRRARRRPLRHRLRPDRAGPHDAA